MTLHPTVPNPYSLLSLIPSEAAYFMLLDLKDAFFSSQLAPQSQPIFVFQWEHPETGRKIQHTWGRLPQGFKNLASLFGVALGMDLQEYPTVPQKRILLQYVDDFLLATSTQQNAGKPVKSFCNCWTIKYTKCPGKRPSYAKHK